MCRASDASTPSELDQILTSGLKLFGVRQYALHLARSAIPLPQEQSIASISSYDSQWQAEYRQHNYMKFDPVAARALQTSSPFDWSELAVSEGSREMMSRAERFDVLDGRSYPLVTPSGFVCLSICVGGAPRDVLSGQHDAVLVHLLPFLREQAVRVCSNVGELPLVLSHMQRCVLSLAHLGLSDRKISDRLEIKPSTVNTHFKNAFLRLGAHNRGSAVREAICRGELTLDGDVS